ncbi:MAG: hypothetical protein WAV90_07865 [Gordonia amarae]
MTSVIPVRTDGVSVATGDQAAAPPGTSPRWMRWWVLGAIIVVALVIRWQFLDNETLDYRAFLSRWYGVLDAQGIDAFKERFADYNYPYLYLIWILTALNIPALVGIKAISIIFDVVLAFFAYRIVALRTERFPLRALAFGVVIALPSVIANSAYWGQADGIYSAFVLGGIYFLLRARHGGIGRSPYLWNSVWACAFFGLALSFKLQAVFVMPVLVWLLLRGRLPWQSLAAIPAVFALLEVPALIAGAPLHDVLTVYLDQTDSYKKLTLGAANLYQLVPIDGDATWLAHAGIVAAGAIVVAFLAWSVWKKPAVTPASILAVATASAVIVPFLLPAMHDRYFYTAEVLSVVLAFYLPLRYSVIPVLIQLAAIGVYHSSLSGDQGMGSPGGGFGGGQGGPGRTGSGISDVAGSTGGTGTGNGGNGPGTGRPGGQSGAPGGGGPGGGNDGYTSGRGDSTLAMCATAMGLSALTLVYAVAHTFRRQVRIS